LFSILVLYCLFSGMYNINIEMCFSQYEKYIKRPADKSKLSNGIRSR
jgi:hypothetical protein